MIDSQDTNPAKSIGIIKGKFFVSEKNIVVFFILIFRRHPSKLEKTLALAGEMQKITSKPTSLSWKDFMTFMYEKYAEGLVNNKETGIISSLMGKQIANAAGTLVVYLNQGHTERINRELSDFFYQYCGHAIELDIHTELITSEEYAKSMFEMNQTQKKQEEKQKQEAPESEGDEKEETSPIGIDLGEFGSVHLFKGNVVTSPNGYPCSAFSSGDKIYVKLDHAEDLEKNFLIKVGAYDAETDRSKRIDATVMKTMRISNELMEMLIKIQDQYCLQVKIESEFNLLAAPIAPSKVEVEKNLRKQKALRKSIYVCAGIIALIIGVVITLIVL